MIHPDIMRLMARERYETLRSAGRHAPQEQPEGKLDWSGIELRLCRVADDEQLEELAQLAERRLPFGRFVVAVVNGRIVAALPLGGGRLLADPFVRTAHLVPLLELRAAQLRTPERSRFVRRSFGLFRQVNLMRGSTHA
jgi:hypothetical protein